MKRFTRPALAIRKEVKGPAGAPLRQCTSSQAPWAKGVYFSILIPQALGANALDAQGMD